MCVKPRENGYSKKWNLNKRVLRSANVSGSGKAFTHVFNGHGEEFARWHKHVVAEPTGNNLSMCQRYDLHELQRADMLTE